MRAFYNGPPSLLANDSAVSGDSIVPCLFMSASLEKGLVKYTTSKLRGLTTLGQFYDAASR